MTDTEILNTVISDLRWHVTTRRPMSPMLAGDLLRTIENARVDYRHATGCSNQNVMHALGAYDGVDKCGCRRYTNGTSFSDKTVSDFYRTPGPYQDITKDNQRFWRCAHHPQAIANWAHDKGWYCERGCDTNELRWSDNGTHHTP